MSDNGRSRRRMATIPFAEEGALLLVDAVDVAEPDEEERYSCPVPSTLPA